jgi:hypothetical protein
VRFIAIVLVVGVFLAHDGEHWLSEGSRFSPAAVFYMLQGAWTVVLSACLLLLLTAAVASVWRDLAVTALGISIVEGSLLPVCRFPVANIKEVPMGVGLCDHVTGLPVHAVLLTLEVLAVVWIAGTGIRSAYLARAA